MNDIVAPYWMYCKESVKKYHVSHRSLHDIMKDYSSFKKELDNVNKKIKETENSVINAGNDDTAAEKLAEIFKLQKKRNDIEDHTNELLLVIYMFTSEQNAENSK